MTDVTEPTQAPAPGGATEHAASTAAVAKDQAASVASSAATEAKAVASEAAAEAKDALTDARQQLRRQAEEQSAKVAALVGDLGNQLRKMAAAGDSGPAKDIVATVADQAKQVSQRLGDGGLDRTLDDARRLARNRPGLFLAGAALAGFVAARVVRVADTAGLKQAATGSNGSSAGGPGDPSFARTATTPSMPAPTPTTPGTTVLPTGAP
jgi:hypothetical protein